MRKRENAARYAAEAGPSLGMWRYRDVLPEVAPVTLGEGWTPMLRSRRHAGLLVKDEGVNPAGSFEARGMAVAVAVAKRDGVGHLALAEGGDAASALAAYAAAAGIAAHVYLTKDGEFENRVECAVYGAEIGGGERDPAWVEVSAEWRIEGAKTMGYEVAEQLGWRYPEAVIFAGGELGVAGIQKAFAEMEAMGWVEGTRPRMYRGEGVSEEEIVASTLDYARHEGLFLSPAGAAGMAVYERLLGEGELRAEDAVVVFDPGLRSVEKMAEALRVRRPACLPRSMPVGGIITPV